MLEYFRGNVETALEYTGRMAKCIRCSHCRYRLCYEKFLIEARIYEMEGNRKMALELYRKALEEAPDDEEIYNAIHALEENE